MLENHIVVHWSALFHEGCAVMNYQKKVTHMNSRFLKPFRILLLCLTSLFLGLLLQASAPKNPVSRSILASAERLFGLNFTDKKRDMMLEGLKGQLDSYQAMRKIPLSNEIPPAQRGMKYG